MRNFLSVILLLLSIGVYSQNFEMVPYRLKNKWGFADSTAKIVIKPKYEAVTPFNRSYAAVKEKGKWGFINLKGEMILTPRYDSVGEYFHGYLQFDDKTGEQKFITGIEVFSAGQKKYVNEKGVKIFDAPVVFSFVDDGESNNRFQFEYIRENNLIGLSFKTGYYVPPQYDTLIYRDANFYDDLPHFLAKKNGKWGIISIRNHVLLDFKYDYLADKKSRYSKIFKKNGKWGIMNSEYKIVFESPYDSIAFAEGGFLVRSKNKWGLIDYDYDTIVPLKYQKIVETEDEKGFYLTDFSGNIGYCTVKGKILVPLEYKYLKKYYYEDFFIYKKDLQSKTVGCLSFENSNILSVPQKYDKIEPFNNGYALVVKIGKSGYISKKGLEFFKK